MSDHDHAIARRTTKPPPGKTAAPPSGTISKQLEIAIILDEPLEDGDKFEITGGGYSKTLTAKDAEQLVKGERLLRFKVKPSKNGYRLIHHHSKGAKSAIFLDTRLQDMTKAGVGPLPSKAWYAHIESQVPKKLLDNYMTEAEVDRDLVQKSPVLVDLKVEDPEL
jgi:hypothetical protein